MAYQVFLRGLRFHAAHGVSPQERTVGGDFLVDVTVHATAPGDSRDPSLTDELSHAVNYAALYDTVRREMATPSNLLEHAARRIGQAILADVPDAIAVDVSLTKLNPPLGADCLAGGAGVTLHLTNDKNYNR